MPCCNKSSCAILTSGFDSLLLSVAVHCRDLISSADTIMEMAQCCDKVCANIRRMQVRAVAFRLHPARYGFLSLMPCKVCLSQAAFSGLEKGVAGEQSAPGLRSEKSEQRKALYGASPHFVGACAAHLPKLTVEALLETRGRQVRFCGPACCRPATQPVPRSSSCCPSQLSIRVGLACP